MRPFSPIISIQDAQEAQEAQEQQAADGITTSYDSTWTVAQIPEQPPLGTERFMLAQDKIYVVLAVVLVIWFGIAYFIFKTDRKLVDLEKQAAERTRDERIPE